MTEEAVAMVPVQFSYALKKQEQVHDGLLEVRIDISWGKCVLLCRACLAGSGPGRSGAGAKQIDTATKQTWKGNNSKHTYDTKWQATTDVNLFCCPFSENSVLGALTFIPDIPLMVHTYLLSAFSSYAICSQLD